MRFAPWSGGVALLIVSALLLPSAGCGKKESLKDTPHVKDADAKGKKDLPKSVAKHAGWWCEEHGVPEHLCSLCDEDVAAKHKKQGDWCKIHDRAQSQCFKCNPDLYKKFEAMYVAKYNKKPEPPPQEEFEK